MGRIMSRANTPTTSGLMPAASNQAAPDHVNQGVWRMRATVLILAVTGFFRVIGVA